jgi:hypothetical protein
MFALTPLAVALQGIGYGSFLSALQGLADVTVAPAAEDEAGPGGVHAPIKARRRVRRAVYLPADWEEPPDPAALAALANREDEELLFELGVL